MSATSKRVAQIIAIIVGVVLVIFGVRDAAATDTGADARSAVSLIAPAGAGGGWDGAAREIQQTMREEGSVVNPTVVNIPGAGGTIGLSQLMEMPGNNTTLMVMGITMLGAININGSGVSIDEVTPIARITDDYDVLVVPADSPYETVDDVMQEMAKDPRNFPWGGGSLGSLDQMIIAQLAQEADIDPKEVNYMAHSGGAELATALLSGTIDASVSGYNDFADQIEAGRLKMLGISAEEPVDGIDTPTMIEQGYDVSLVNWRGVVAPPGLEDEDVEELRTIMREVLESDTWAEVLERNQWADSALIGEDFAANLEEERAIVDDIWAQLGY
ncbi:MAG: tripartite tricarboxylate transporter substrate-binding protein [Corynebacterium casei]|nr:tripartite tricarboxylate transporter substrate-binding protein [Corynebacterium casei]